MGLTTIRAQIKAIIQAVDATSKVHDYERWANEQASVLSFFQPSANGPLRAWLFRLDRREQFTLTNQDVLVVYTFLFRAVYSVDDSDATGKTFEDLLMTVQDEFQKLSRVTLNSTCETTDVQEGPLAGRSGLQIEKIDFLKLAGAMVHYAEGRLGAQEIIERV